MTDPGLCSSPTEDGADEGLPFFSAQEVEGVFRKSWVEVSSCKAISTSNVSLHTARLSASSQSRSSCPTYV